MEAAVGAAAHRDRHRGCHSPSSLLPLCSQDLSLLGFLRLYVCAHLRLSHSAPPPEVHHHATLIPWQIFESSSFLFCLTDTVMHRHLHQVVHRHCCDEVYVTSDTKDVVTWVDMQRTGTLGDDCIRQLAQCWRTKGPSAPLKYGLPSLSPSFLSSHSLGQSPHANLHSYPRTP